MRYATPIERQRLIREITDPETRADLRHGNGYPKSARIEMNDDGTPRRDRAGKLQIVYPWLLSNVFSVRR